jgi:hypothetical protein
MNRMAILGASVLLSVAGLAVAGPARADNSDCPADSFCLFEDDDFGGGRAVFTGDDSDLTSTYWDDASRPVQNGASSMINNMGGSVSLRSDAGVCSGDSYTAQAESEDRDFTNNHFDNEASCVQVN